MKTVTACALAMLGGLTSAQTIGAEVVYDFEDSKAYLAAGTTILNGENWFIEDGIENLLAVDFDIELRALVGIGSGSADFAGGFSLVGVFPLDPNGSAFYAGAAWIHPLGDALGGRPALTAGFRFAASGP